MANVQLLTFAADHAYPFGLSVLYNKSIKRQPCTSEERGCLLMLCYPSIDALNLDLSYFQDQLFESHQEIRLFIPDRNRTRRKILYFMVGLHGYQLSWFIAQGLGISSWRLIDLVLFIILIICSEGPRDDSLNFENFTVCSWFLIFCDLWWIFVEKYLLAPRRSVRDHSIEV